MTDDSTPAADKPERPIPDLGFFGGAPASSPLFGAPAASQFGGRPPSQFGGAPTSQFGAPAATPFGAPPATPFGAPVTQAQPVPATTGAGMPGWAIALLVVGSLVALVIAASVAIPVFLVQRDKGIAQRTTIEMPMQIGAFVRVDDPKAAASEQTFERGIEGDVALRDLQAGIYRSGDVQAMVMGARPTKALTREDQQKVAEGFVAKIEQETGFPPVLAPVLRGSLTGTFGCAQVSAGQAVNVVCLATSPGAVVVVVVDGAAYDEAKDAAVTLREGVEHQS